MPQQILNVHSWQDVMLGIWGIKSKGTTKLTLESSMSTKKCMAGTAKQGQEIT